MPDNLRFLKVDEKNRIFNTRFMRSMTFPSDFSKIRAYSLQIIGDAPEEFKENHLLEQQVSEMLKNAIEHGNKCDLSRKVRVWTEFSLRKDIVRVIMEDEGDGFQNLEDWNEFYKKRNYYIDQRMMDKMMEFIHYRTDKSLEFDGGNALLAAIEYWNGGIVYNDKRNKVGMLRRFARAKKHLRPALVSVK
jgi:serine/threonine-protein kinase RsbW